MERILHAPSSSLPVLPLHPLTVSSPRFSFPISPPPSPFLASLFPPPFLEPGFMHSDDNCCDHLATTGSSCIVCKVSSLRPLQWRLISETRRSFITGFLQHSSQRILRRFSTRFAGCEVVVSVKPSTFARRIAVMMPVFFASSMMHGRTARAAQTESLRNTSSSFLQNLGLGDPDIYYPSVFEGSWVCNSTLIAVDTPQGEDKADMKSIESSRKQLGYTVTYKARFIPFRNYIIGDRLFTTLSLVESTVGKNVVDQGIWSPEKPDRLTLILRGGRKVQNVVTKRSTSLLGPGQFETSEYSQQIFDNPKFEGGPPTIKASQNRTRYRWDAAVGEVPYIEAFQKVSMFPVINEGFSDLDLMSLDKPIAVYKYLVRFTRDIISSF